MIPEETIQNVLAAECATRWVPQAGFSVEVQPVVPGQAQLMLVQTARIYALTALHYLHPACRS